MPKLSHAEALRYLGGAPEAVSAELRAFSDAAKVLSSDHPRLIDEHPLQWVAVYQGQIAATAKSFKSLLAQLARKGGPPEKTIVRFIDKEQRTLIL